MKRSLEETPPHVSRYGVILSQNNNTKPENVDDDYYYCHTAYLRGVADPLLKNVKIPFGAARIPHIYDLTPDGRVPTFPRLSHRTALPLFPDIIAANYPLPKVPEDIWHFSLASLLFQDEAWDAMNEQRSSDICVDYVTLINNYNAAVLGFDRDALAPIYAHLDRVMTTLFNMHIRTVSTLDLRHLLPYIARIYTEGIEVALVPCSIPLWPNLTKRIFHKYVPGPEDTEAVVFDEDDGEDARDYDEDGAFDGGEALFGSVGLCETLVLKGTPKKLMSSSSAVSKPTTSVEARGFVMASKKPIEIALPLPDISKVSVELWMGYAVRKVVSTAFSRDSHYYCTSSMLDAGLKKYDEKAAKGLFPTPIDRSKLPVLLSEMSAKGDLVLAIGKEVVDSIGEMGDDLRVFTTLAWRQEQEILEKLDIIAAKPVTASKYFEPDSAIIFSKEQVHAINSAVTQPMTVITGPGGAGKTLVMHEIYKRLRAKYGPSARMLFVSFRNGIVNRLIADINRLDGKTVNPCTVAGVADGEGDDMEAQKPLIFKTCDSVIYGLTKKKKILDPVAVFMEEAGQSCGAHFQGVLRAIRLDRVRHFIMIGDSQQRVPIKQGAPFKYIIHMYPSVVCRLNQVYRTGCEELKKRQKMVLDGDSHGVLAESNDSSLSIDFTPEGRGRMYAGTMSRFCDMIYARLTKWDITNEMYDDIMGLCAYNDYCEVGNAIVTQYYFDPTLNLDSAFDDILKKRQGRGMNIFVGMRVVFNENRKVGEDGFYSRGSVGKVVCILSSGGKKGEFRFPDRHAINETWIKESKKCTGVLSNREFGALYVRLLDTGEMVKMEFQGSRGLSASTISIAHFITCDRAQGLEYKYTLMICPWGNNLATRDVFNTMFTRPKNVMGLIGQKSHMEKMIDTPPEIKMTRFLDHYK